MLENIRCRCGHLRGQHADRETRVGIEPLEMTEADEHLEPKRLPDMLRGLGHCTVEGCGCHEFIPDQ